MNSLAYIPGSDGVANASLMTVTNVRSGGATTIQVNTVANVPAKFYASMGTPHTFTDPVTGETITVVSEATAVDFAGEIDGSNIEIVEVAPGFTDNGSEVGDIIIIRPITEWANNLFNVLSQAHQDDGKLKTDSLDEFFKPSEIVGSFVGTGGVWSQLSGLNGAMTAIAYYISGVRCTSDAIASKTFTASKDTYVDIGIDGVVDYNETTNAGTPPALAADHMRIAKIVTNGSAITSIQQAGTDTAGYSIYNLIPTRNAIKNNYSTVTEVNTGAFWIDGKPIYKKTVNFGSLPNNTSKSVAHGITGLDYIIEVTATSQHGSDGSVLVLPYVNPASTDAGIYANTTDIVVITGGNRTAFTKTYVTLLYTKT